MSLCIYYNITFLTSFVKPMHGFPSNSVWMFLGWAPTKIVPIRIISWNYW